MATNLPSCFTIQFLEQLLKFLISFALLKYVKSQRSYGFLITEELNFGFQILDLKDHGFVDCSMERSVRYNFLIDLESIQHKLSTDYSLNIRFSRRFPYIDGP